MAARDSRRLGRGRIEREKNRQERWSATEAAAVPDAERGSDSRYTKETRGDSRVAALTCQIIPLDNESDETESERRGCEV